ncbi:hypothetical protein WIS52_06010 [Pseudonocardia nematodicida]|uniref:Uncharacterized protein n=1 Tax=Pseudonocardia nematodicida TaxID=1206997 RepID=A0ABV1K6B6_9PSEU
MGGPFRVRKRTLFAGLAFAVLAVWIGGTFVAIVLAPGRGAEDPASLGTRAAEALRDGDGNRFHDLLLDAPDREFSQDYAQRLRALGVPELAPTGPETAEIRSGPYRTTLSVTEENGRWYLSLLPPGD